MRKQSITTKNEEVKTYDDTANVIVKYNGNPESFKENLLKQVTSFYKANQAIFVDHCNVSLGLMFIMGENKHGTLVGSDIVADLTERGICSQYYKTFNQIIVGVPVSKLADVDVNLKGMKVDVHIYID